MSTAVHAVALPCSTFPAHTTHYVPPCTLQTCTPSCESLQPHCFSNLYSPLKIKTCFQFVWCWWEGEGQCKREERIIWAMFHCIHTTSITPPDLSFPSVPSNNSSRQTSSRPVPEFARFPPPSSAAASVAGTAVVRCPGPGGCALPTGAMRRSRGRGACPPDTLREAQGGAETLEAVSDEAQSGPVSAAPALASGTLGTAARRRYVPYPRRRRPRDFPPRDQWTAGLVRHGDQSAHPWPSFGASGEHRRVRRVAETAARRKTSCLQSPRLARGGEG